MGVPSPEVVFVVGAGASKPFGFPTGIELRDRVVELENSTLKLGEFRSITRIDRRLSKKELQDVRSLAQQLPNARTSVDLFIEGRPELEWWGKRLMVEALLGYEKEFYNRPNWALDWYQWLFNRLFPTSKPVLSKSLGIVSLNYERTLHETLVRMSACAFRMRRRDAIELLRPVQITHVYGSMCTEPSWDRAEDIVDYSPTDVQADRSVEMLRTVRSSELDSTSLFRDACAMTWCCNWLYFLGFGYDRTNMRRIGIRPDVSAWSSRVRGINIQGTALAMTNAERGDARKAIGREDVYLDDKNRDCLAFLRHQIDSSIL